MTKMRTKIPPKISLTHRANMFISVPSWFRHSYSVYHIEFEYIMTTSYHMFG